MSSSLEELAETFSYLHDGVVEAFERDGSTLILKVRIRYLAQRIDPAYEDLTIRVLNAREIVLAPWWDEENNSQLTDLQEILGTSPWILGAGVENGRLELVCSGHQTDLGYAGGTLSMLADGLEIFDPGGKPISAAELAALSDGYWSEAARRASGVPVTELN